MESIPLINSEISYKIESDQKNPPGDRVSVECHKRGKLLNFDWKTWEIKAQQGCAVQMTAKRPVNSMIKEETKMESAEEENGDVWLDNAEENKASAGGRGVAFMLGDFLFFSIELDDNGKGMKENAILKLEGTPPSELACFRQYVCPQPQKVLKEGIISNG